MRLTHYDEHKKRWQINDDYGAVMIDGLNYAIGEAIDKLAAYEDAGLEPEQIAEYLNATDEYVRASEEGRLIILPCKVGDTVYRICHEYKQGNPFIRAVTFSQHNFWRIVFAGEMGKTVFLTREEAEAALKGEKA